MRYFSDLAREYYEKNPPTPEIFQQCIWQDGKPVPGAWFVRFPFSGPGAVQGSFATYDQALQSLKSAYGATDESDVADEPVAISHV